jgi:hypothetical protein
MRIFKAAFTILLLAGTSLATDRYASATGSGSTCSSGTPCSFNTAVAASSAGDTVFLLDDGGTFNGKFTVSVSGSSGNRITIRAASGELPVFDGYVTTQLNGGINNSTTTVVVDDASKMEVGQVITLHDGTEGTEEQMQIGGISTNTLTVTRAWNGTSAVTHSDNAVVVLGGDQILVSGSYITFRGLEVKNTDPTRIQTPPNSQNAPHLRGEGFFILGDFVEIQNCSIHDNQDGVFNSASAVGTKIEYCVIYNNGYVAGGAYNGHGIYAIHEDVSQIFTIIGNIIFNNSNHGIKGDSQNGDTVNITCQYNISFNSGCWANTDTRNFNLLMSSNNGVAEDLIIDTNYLFHPAGKNGTNLKVGLGDTGGTTTITNNDTAYGVAWAVQDYSPLTVSGNRIVGDDNTGGGNSTMILYDPVASPSVSWNLNSYFNLITDAKGYYPTNGSSSSTFAQWKTATSFDAGSTESTSLPVSNWEGARVNAYDSNLAFARVFNWTGGTTAAVTTAMFTNGDTIAVHIAEEGTWPSGSPATSVTVSAGTVTVPMNGSTVVAQIGQDGSTIITPTTMRSAFAAFILVRTAQAPTNRGAMSGKATISGKAVIN